MSILHFTGILLMIFVAGFSAYLYVNASKLEKEIEADIGDRSAE